MKKTKILQKEQNKAESKIKEDGWAQMDRNIGKFTDDFMSARDQGKSENRKAIDDACAGKGLSQVYTDIEEMFDDLDAETDRAVKRKGLKEENPFDVLARQAVAESRAGKTVTLEEFERQMKKRAFRESHRKAVKRLKST